MKNGADTVNIEFSDLSILSMSHSQNCCEAVWLEDVIGDPADLIGVPLLMCEEVDSDQPEGNEYGDVSQATWYKFRTNKGDVTLRWMGTSNGYYSTSVDLYTYTVDLNTDAAKVEWDALLEKYI